MRYFILIKRKNSKYWSGAIPAKKGLSKVRIQKSARKSIRKGLTFRVVNQKQLINFLKRLKPRTRRRKKKR